MEQKQIEVVGKVFVVVDGKRRCLLCDGMFTPKHADVHATVPCSAVLTQLADKLVC